MSFGTKHQLQQCERLGLLAKRPHSGLAGRIPLEAYRRIGR